MRNGEWLQRLLYILMAVLSTYIIYKGGEVLVREADLSEIVPDEWKKGIEDAAVSAYAPAYSAAVRGDGTGNWISEWMEQLVPIYTYMADPRRQRPEANRKKPVSRKLRLNRHRKRKLHQGRHRNRRL